MCPKTKRCKFIRLFTVLGIYNFGWSQEVGILFFAKRGTRTYLLCPMQKYVLCSTKKEGWTNKIAAILEGLRISRWLLFLACKQSRQQQNSSFLFECLFILFGIPELLLHTVKHVCFSVFSLNFIENNCFVIEVDRGKLQHMSNVTDHFGFKYYSVLWYRRWHISNIYCWASWNTGTLILHYG